jgi:hypothetical protein
MRDGDIRRGRAAIIGFVFIFVFASGLGAVCGCSADVFDVTVDLKPQTFALDFGQQTGTIPTVTCDDTIVEEVCGSGQSVSVDTTSTTGVPSDVQMQLGCDANTARCFAQATGHASQPVNVLQDDAFVTRIERNALSFVHLVDVAYTIPANTLTFDIPQIDIYAGPAGSRRETDPGVAIVGSTEPIAAGTVVTDPLHVMITDDTPARPVIEDAIENKQEFVFIVVATPRIDAGAPIPAGAVQIDVAPSLVIGLPR